MKTHGMSSSEALKLVKCKRSVAAPNAGFILQLQSYEKSLPGLQVKSLAFRIGNILGGNLPLDLDSTSIYLVEDDDEFEEELMG
ncbi:LOW QUALITY PROTEIN: hypothetical protein M8C21_009068, partial [Ambrosia artemisiifolia]